MNKNDIATIKKYNQSLANKSAGLIVFDLDSTIYNVSPRTQKIVDEFCTNEEYYKIHPEAVDVLKQIKIKSSDWGFSEALEREDFISNIKLTKALSALWRKHFFSNEYIQYDELYKNSKSYILQLKSQNIQIKYLTGRSEKLMQEGTLKRLLQDEIYKSRTNELIMKTTHQPDHIYKLEVVLELLKTYNDIVIYENEPKIINYIAQYAPKVKFVFMDSTHSRQETLNMNVPTINMDYSPLIE